MILTTKDKELLYELVMNELDKERVRRSKLSTKGKIKESEDKIVRLTHIRAILKDC